MPSYSSTLTTRQVSISAAGLNRQQQQGAKHLNDDDSLIGNSSTQATNKLPLLTGGRVSEASANGSGSSSPMANINNNNRDLGTLIDLMPPLSIEPGTKRLILAKKLDREDLDKYIRLTSNGIDSVNGQTLSQTATSSSSQQSPSSSSSSSLTVHIKCQLKHPGGSTSNSNNDTLKNPTVQFGNTDNGKSRYSSSNSNSVLIPVHLIVTDENDNWPIFIGAPYIIDLNESVQVGSLLQGNEIVAFDNDQQGPLSTIEYSIVAGNYWSDSFAFLNPLDSRSLIVRDNRILDCESQSKLTLKVMARDQGDPSNWAIASLYINLMDSDDLSPSFAEDKYFGYIKDNRPGELVDVMPKQLFARDGDKALNTPVVYSFHSKTNYSIHFDLDPEVGKLSLRKSFPSTFNHNKQPFCLLIRATQVDNPNRWSVTAINVRLSRPPSVSNQLEQLLSLSDHHHHHHQISSIGTASNVNDRMDASPFAFSHTNFTIEVEESLPVGFSIFTAKATNIQIGSSNHHQTITYELLDNELGYFNINQSTGRLSINKSLDYELYRHLSVRILAVFEQPVAATSYNNDNSPNVYPKMVCDITRLNVVIIDQNEFTPEFSHQQYNFQLPLSDLIASFEPTRPLQEQVSDSKDSDRRSKQLVSKRSATMSTTSGGDLELIEEELDELFGARVLQLGQIYCSDRDSNDKVTLQLTGSKASLFHLTQDGRLYLPLTNVSSAGSQPNPDLSLVRRRDSESNIIKNQFIQNRLIASSSNRRLDSSMTNDQTGAGSKAYLNYLLGELSSLSRLRLKVIATDNGEPKSRQSDSLIVLTIISIDNFILQRTYQTIGTIHSASSSLGPFPINNMANKTMTSNNGQQTDQFASLLANKTTPSTSHVNQVMMIPSNNGKGFVQVNADIVGTFLGGASKTNGSGSVNNINPMHKSPDFDSNNRIDSLDSAASSNAIVLQLASQQQTTNESHSSSAKQLHNDKNMMASLQTHKSHSHHHPSLLVVDEDGAKFLTMPAAIEVYNQQVQEAFNQQQQSATTKQSLFEPTKRRSLKGTPEVSIWSQWKSQFGLDSDPMDSSSSSISTPMFWINMSTTIMLHLIALAIIVTLINRVRSSYRASSSSNNSSIINEANSSNGFFCSQMKWPKRLKLSIFGNSGSSNNTNIRTQVVTITGSEHTYMRTSNKNLGPSVTAIPNCTLESYAFSTPTSSSSSSSSSSQPPVDQSKNNDHQQVADAANSGNKHYSNVFGHLKMSLNKMLDICDIGKQQTSSCSMRHKKEERDLLGQITIRPLSSSTTSSLNNHNDRLSQIASEQQPTGASLSMPSSSTKSSTFVGPLQQQPVSTTGSVQKNGNIVSISVKSAAPRHEATSRKPNLSSKKNERLEKQRSSSSSVVSLVSMSSSISNKINDVTIDHNNANDNNSGDVSSLDSTTLFGAITKHLQLTENLVHQSATQATSAANISLPAPPPPPPPPPPPSSVIQTGAVYAISSVQKPLSSSVGPAENKEELNKPQSRGTEINNFNSTSRLTQQPQNPVHVKLRQQALSEQIVSDLRRQSLAKQRLEANGVLERVLPPPSTSPSPLLSNANHNQNSNHNQPDTLTQTNTIKQVSSKTVSPTTSVDRGYESLQSYTSSQNINNNTIKQHIKHQTTMYNLNDLGQFVQQQQHERNHVKPETEGLDQIYLPPSTVCCTTRRAEGRQAQRTSNSLRISQQTRGQVVAQIVQDASEYDVPNTLANDRPLVQKHPQLQLVEGRNSSSNSFLITGKRQQNKNRSGNLFSLKEAVADAETEPVMKGYETEDDDFYYCCDSRHKLSQVDLEAADNNVKQSSTRLAVNSSALIEYANHAYQVQPQSQSSASAACDQLQTKMTRQADHDRGTAKTIRPIVTSTSSLKNKKQSTSSPRGVVLDHRENNNLVSVRLNGTNPSVRTQLHYNKTTSTSHSTSMRYNQSQLRGSASKQQMQQHRSNAGFSRNRDQQTNRSHSGHSGGNSNKKHLTWSDQISMAP